MFASALLAHLTHSTVGEMPPNFCETSAKMQKPDLPYYNMRGKKHPPINLKQ